MNWADITFPDIAFIYVIGVISISMPIANAWHVVCRYGFHKQSCIYDQIWSHISCVIISAVIYDHLCLYIHILGPTYDRLCPYMMTYDCVWQHKLAYMDKYDIFESYVITYRHISSYMVSYMSLYDHTYEHMQTHTSSYIILYVHAWSNIWLRKFIYDHIRLYNKCLHMKPLIFH